LLQTALIALFLAREVLSLVPRSFAQIGVRHALAASLPAVTFSAVPVMFISE